MSKGTVNKVILVGRLGADPEVRYTQSGMAIGTLNLATNHSVKGADGQYTDATEWHRVIVMGKMAETIQQYARKGSQLYIEGRLQTRKWQDQQGVDKYTTEIVANEFQFIGGKSDGEQQQQAPRPSMTAMPQPQSQPQPNLYAQAKGDKPVQRQQPNAEQMQNGFSDDNIPF